MTHYKILVLTVLFLASCGTEPTLTHVPSETPDAVATKVAIEKAAAATLIAEAPTSMASPTKAPTSTQVPTETSDVVATKVAVEKAAAATLTVEAPTSMPSPTKAPSPTPTPLASPTPGPMSQPADPGCLTFVSGRDKNWEIYLKRADSSQPVRLTFSLASEWCPRWSPDGTRIAFLSDRDGNWELYTMKSNGTGLVRLTDNPARDTDPAWSPDGTRMAFASTQDGNQDIYVMNADGSGLTRLTDDPADEGGPAWSPDGERLAFHAHLNDNWDIYVMNIDGSGLTRLTDDPASDWSPAWSPDGTRLAFVSQRDGNGEIYLMDANGEGQTRLTNSAAEDSVPTWSPDGAHVAFVSKRDGNEELYRIDVDGKQEMRLTNNPATDTFPSWSARSCPDTVIQDPIHVLNQQLAAHDAHLGLRDMAWSPDGETLAVTGETGTHLFSTDPTTEPALVGDSTDVVGLAFHPSGMFLATASQTGTVAIWDVVQETLASTLTFDAEFGQADGIFFNEAGDRLTVFFPAASGQVGYLYSYDTTQITQPWEILEQSIRTQSVTEAFAVAPDGQLAAVAHFLGNVEVYYLHAAQPPIWTFDSFGPAVSLAFSDEGRYLAAGTLAGHVAIADTQGQQVLDEIRPPPDLTHVNVNDLVFRPGSDQLLFGISYREVGTEMDQGSVTLWSMENGVRLAEYHTAVAVERLALDSSGQYLAIATETGIEVLDLRQWMEAR